MAMSDCSRCWSTPCSCGWEYRDWSIESITNLIDVLLVVTDYKKVNKNGLDERKFKEYLQEHKL